MPTWIEEIRPDQADMRRPLVRVDYDGSDFGLGKLNNKRAFSCLSVLADLGLLRVD